MYGLTQNAKHLLRSGAALLAAVLLILAMPSAAAADVNAAVDSNGAKMLVPVGHTVGIKLFSKGVLVVKLPEGETPARECGLKSGDVIVSCGGTAIQSTEQFKSLLQEAGEKRRPGNVD